MRTWAVTGGIATGKSSFCDLVRRWEGVEFFDCDASVHDLLTKPEVTAMISASFPGEEVLTDDGGLDRSRLRDLVFSDRAKRKILEEILHPRVRECFFQTREGALTRGDTTLLVADIPLLYETQFDIDQDLEIVVATSAGVQKKRLLARSGLSEEMADRIIDSQLPIADKIGRAGCVIWNDGSPESLSRQAETLRNWKSA